MLALVLIITSALKPFKAKQNHCKGSFPDSSATEKNDFFNAYYVGGKKASDSNPGTKKAPFATISKAAEYLKEGDTCIIRAGI